MKFVGLIFSIGFLSAQSSPPAARPTHPEQLSYPELKPLRIPDVVTLTLPNGMRLYLLENHELPLVSGFALVRTGNLFDLPDRVGLAGITGSVMRTGGTKGKTGEQLDVQLENMAASVESGIGETSGSVSFSALKENADEVLQVFHDVLTSPEFRQDKLDLAKLQSKGGISRRNDDPSGILEREFASILYGKSTPYGWDAEYETIDRIRREDVIAFHRRYFFPRNIMLAVQGDFSASAMRARLETLFSDWNVQQEPVPPFPIVKEGAHPGVYLAAKDDVTQTFFSVGHLGGTLRDKDYPALQVMADILGGGFSSRLFVRVRTQLGYAYSVGANWGATFDHPGLFQISGSTKSATSVDTIKAIMEEVERLRASEVTPAELETAKQTVLNSFVFNFDSPSKTLNRLITYEYFGYPKDFINQYQKQIAAVTGSDVLRVAKQYLRPRDLSIVAVGNPAQFGKPFQGLGLPVTPIDLSIKQPAAGGASGGTHP